MAQWNNPTSNLLDSMLRSALDQQVLNQGRTVAQVLAGVPPTSREAARPASPVRSGAQDLTSFRSTGRRILPARLARESAGTTAAQRRELVKTYEDLLDQYEKAGRTTHVAAALAYLVLASIFVTRDGEEVAEEVQEQIVAQLDGALGAAPAFASTPARGRQELYESLVISAALALNAYADAARRGDVAQVVLAKRMAAASFQFAFGRRIEDVILTPSGLVFG